MLSCVHGRVSGSAGPANEEDNGGGGGGCGYARGESRLIEESWKM